MLHIVNGSTVSVAEACPGGEVLCWNDVLHEGPVPELPLEELRHIRAAFVARLSGEPEAEVLAEFERRDAVLQRLDEHEEVVLWFEHDLFDQLQLIQILDYLGGASRASTRITLVQAVAYLGSMQPWDLARLFTERRDVTGAQFETGRRAWAAFRSPDPAGLTALVEADTESLPLLKAAMVRHLEQFPWMRDGLNRTERQILEAVAAGARTVGEAFRANREEPRFMGDLPYADWVRSLAACRRPLIEVTEQGRLMDTRLRLTVMGAAVLEGRRDHLDLNGIDRWLGGVHLSTPGPVWRWDGTRLTLTG